MSSRIGKGYAFDSSSAGNGTDGMGSIRDGSFSGRLDEELQIEGIPVAEREAQGLISETRIIRSGEEIISVVNEQNKEIIGLIKKFEEQKGECKKAQAAARRLKTDIEARGVVIKEYEATSLGLMAIISQQDEKLRKLEDERQSAVGRRDALTRDIRRLAESLGRGGNGAEAAEIRQELEDAKFKLEFEDVDVLYIFKKIEDLSSENAALKKQLADCEGEKQRLQTENNDLKAQLEAKQAEVDALQNRLGEILECLKGEIAGETAGVVLDQLRALRHVAAFVPVDTVIELHIKCIGVDITSVEDIGKAITYFESIIGSTPERIEQAFGEKLDEVWEIFSQGNTLDGTPDANVYAERFFKLAARIDVDFADRELNFDDFNSACIGIINGLFSKLLVSEEIASLRSEFGGGIDEFLAARAAGVLGQILAYAGGSRSPVEVLNEIGRLMLEVKTQAIEDLRYKAAEQIFDAMRTGNFGDEEGQVSDQYVENFLNLCAPEGSSDEKQRAAYEVIRAVEASKVEAEMRPLAGNLAQVIVERGIALGQMPEEDVGALFEWANAQANAEIDGAVNAIRANYDLEVGGGIYHFKSQCATALARALGEPMRLLANYRYDYQTGKDFDAIKNAFSTLNDVSNGLVCNSSFEEWRRRSLPGDIAELVEHFPDVIEGSFRGEVPEESLRALFFMCGNAEDLLFAFNLYMSNRVGVSEKPLAIGEEMVARYMKVQSYIANLPGDFNPFDDPWFVEMLSKFYEQFVQTAEIYAGIPHQGNVSEEPTNW